MLGRQRDTFNAAAQRRKAGSGDVARLSIGTRGGRMGGGAKSKAKGTKYQITKALMKAEE